MIIKKLDYERYKGQKYQAEILSDRYLSIDPVEEGFDIGWVMSDWRPFLPDRLMN